MKLIHVLVVSLISSPPLISSKLNKIKIFESGCDSLILEETDIGSKRFAKKYQVINGSLQVVDSSVSTPTVSLFRLNNMNSLTKTVFLPIGYPNSVPPEYAIYKKWIMLQDLCSNLRSTMATQAMLGGFGVGRSDVTATQATLQWVIRDGISLIGGLIFTAIMSDSFGQNLKLWRLFADNINNVAITVEMAAPHFPTLFLPLICIASLCKAVCGIAAGATGAVIGQHWAERNRNIADILSKSVAQYTVVSIVGLAAGMQLTRLLSRMSSPVFTAAVYAFLTGLHMFSNYRALRVLALRSLNTQRYGLLVEQALSQLRRDDLNSVTAAAFQSCLAQHDQHYTPAAIAKVEPLWSQLLPCKFVPIIESSSTTANGWLKPYPEVIINTWCSLSAAFAGSPDVCRALSAELQRYAGEKYVITVRSSGNNTQQSSCKFSRRKHRYCAVNVCFQSHSQPIDHAKALFEASLIRRQMHLCLGGDCGSDGASMSDSSRDCCREAVRVCFPIFWNHLRRHGWKCDGMRLKQPRSAKVFAIV